MDKDIIVSIVIAAYNVEKYIDKCMNSILNQTYKNIQIIPVNDGSKDNTLDILKSYNDSRILIVDKENGGLSSARNAGIAQAIGDYIVFIDGDDYIEENYIAYMLDEIIKTNSDLCLCNYRRVDDNGNILSYSCEAEKIMNSHSFFNTPSDQTWLYVAWNKMYRKSLFDNVKYKEGKLHEDLFIFYDIISLCNRICSVEHILYSYVFRDDSITTKKYSSKRLDEIEASIILVDNLYNSKNYYLIPSLFKSIINHFLIGYKHKDNDGVSLRLKKLRVEYKKITKNKKFKQFGVKVLYWKSLNISYRIPKMIKAMKGIIKR